MLALVVDTSAHPRAAYPPSYVLQVLTNSLECQDAILNLNPYQVI